MKYTKESSEVVGIASAIRRIRWSTLRPRQQSFFKLLAWLLLVLTTTILSPTGSSVGNSLDENFLNGLTLQGWMPIGQTLNLTDQGGRSGNGTTSPMEASQDRSGLAVAIEE